MPFEPQSSGCAFVEAREDRIRIVISGGGTGGHIYPGWLAVATLLRDKYNADILYLGSDDGAGG